ncbi:MAG: S24 family peptidase [Hyphomicrobiaceae bacterium]|nr:S24 family peptidase [Hyphomicrobiaceae bacterium]
MADLKEIVAARLDQLGLKPIPAAVNGGLERGFIRDILEGRKKSVHVDKLPKLAAALQLDAADLAQGIATPIGAPIPNATPAQSAPLPAGRTSGFKDVPVLGTAAGAATGHGAFQITTDVIDYVLRPAGLATAKDIYALYVEGSSMEPRFFPGDLIYVSPHKPVRIGDVVVIQEPDTNNGEPQAFIKLLERRTAERIITRQYNPDATIEFRARDGVKIHKVLTNNELYGI